MLHRQSAAEEAPARFTREHVPQTAPERAGMRAASHALAVRREDQRLDVLEPRLADDFGEAVMQALVREARRDLADEAAGVGIAGLHGEAATLRNVVAIGFLGEQALDEARTGFERGRRFEQRRDVDDLGHAEQLGEVERDQDRARRLAFRDQVADRGVAIDVLRRSAQPVRTGGWPWRSRGRASRSSPSRASPCGSSRRCARAPGVRSGRASSSRARMRGTRC